MKKKEVSAKSVKHKSQDSTKKPSLSKIKSKSAPKKEDPSVFVFVGDSFYVASTKTERRSYEQFEQKVKVTGNHLKKSRSRPQNSFTDSINLQEYVKTLSKEEKANLLRDLAKEVEPQQSQEQSHHQEDKMERLQERLEIIKGELVARWDQQIDKINHNFQNEQIGLQEKNQKITLINKIKSNKIAMIDYTKILFQKILKEEPHLEVEKSQRFDTLLHSLAHDDPSAHHADPYQSLQANSYPTFQADAHHSLQYEPQQNIPLMDSITPQQFFTALDVSSIPNKEEHQHQLQQSFEKGEPHSSNEQNHYQPIKIEEGERPEPVIMTREQLKLDIRLDQVQFGRDNYEEQVIYDNPISIAAEQLPKDIKTSPQGMTEVLRLEFMGEKKEGETAGAAEFLCVGEDQKIEIPLLLTKDRLEQLQLQKSAKEIQALGMSIKERHSFQMSEVPPKTQEHFTTLIDVNQFLVQFYEFLMRNFMREVIQGMNMPYGKSCSDKLYMLRQEGVVPDHQHNNVLTEEFLARFQQEYTLTVRILRQDQKAHNRALFHAFNNGLNVYRPYFQLQGEVFPWNTSEKGLTFYEISEDNIEEVFEKSKMKVLEYCSSLCGLLPDCPLTTVDARKVLAKRNEDNYQRVLKSEVVEGFGEWSIKKVNFDALARLNLCEEIFQSEINALCHFLLSR